LGQQNDFTAVSVIKPIVIEGQNQYHLVHLERFQLHTPYPMQVLRVKEILHRIDSPTLIIDRTGVGIAVFDMFRATGLNPIGISIHGGDHVTREDCVFRVPKRDLVGSLTVAFQKKELRIPRTLPEADTLVRELSNFRIKVSVSGHDSYEAWREDIHDDLVLSVAMAVWYASSQQSSHQGHTQTIIPKWCNTIPTLDGLPSLPKGWRPFSI
jgi:hypothetical protein